MSLIDILVVFSHHLSTMVGHILHTYGLELGEKYSWNDIF